MQDRATTTWRRRSDIAAASADEKTGTSMRSSAEKLEAWEDEGGRTGSISSEVLRILIVDNDMRAADSLELMLNAEGYSETRVAYSAHAALAFAAEFRPDVAFVEMNLLDLDSNELAQLLRERAQLQHLRLIAMTSSRQHTGRDIARNAGFERYLLKPIAAADVSSLLADTVRRADARDARPVR
jgi:PleD family two-component response regulator